MDPQLAFLIRDQLYSNYLLFSAVVAKSLSPGIFSPSLQPPLSAALFPQFNNSSLHPPHPNNSFSFHPTQLRSFSSHPPHPNNTHNCSNYPTPIIIDSWRTDDFDYSTDEINKSSPEKENFQKFHDYSDDKQNFNSNNSKKIKLNSYSNISWIVSKGFEYLPGLRNQSQNFSHINQCTANCVASIIMSRILSPLKWTNMTIEQVLINGDQLYSQTIKSHKLNNGTLLSASQI